MHDHRQTMPAEVIETREPCWDYFGLSYAAYLVLPRVLLCSAPVEWQDRFVAMMNELEEMFPEECAGSYWVRKMEGNRFVEDPLKDYRHMKQEPKKQTEDPFKDHHCQEESHGPHDPQVRND